MSKDSFNWKNLFINNDNESLPKIKEIIPDSLPIDDTRFPVESNLINQSSNTNIVNNKYIDEILGVYEKGFDSLNLENFDFFELYKSVVAVGVTNPQSYHMAFTMGKTLKSDLTKEYLIEKSKYYIDEIEKVYTNYNNTGNKRRNDLDTSITRNKINLAKSISDLDSKIIELQKEMDQKKAELTRIDFDNQNEYTEIQMKIEANDFAKQKIIDSINLVVSGINQYL